MGEQFNLKEELKGGKYDTLGKQRLESEEKEGEGEEGRGPALIYGWSARKVEACKQNDKWVSSDRVLY